MPALVRRQSSELTSDLSAKVRRYVDAALSETTRRAYRRFFGRFTAWCELHGRANLPASAETVTLYLADIADRYRPGTLSTILTVIGHAHRAAGHPFDRASFQLLMQGIHRTYGSPNKPRAAVKIEQLRELVPMLPDTLVGSRDRVMLTLGFAAALLPSELTGLDIGRPGPRSLGFVEIEQDWLRVTLHRSQSGQPALIKAVPRGGSPCPLEALERWLALAGISSGPILRRLRKNGPTQYRLQSQNVNRVVQRAIYVQAVRGGMDADNAWQRAKLFGGHSLRAGFVTSAVLAGASSESIARHVGWKSIAMVGHYRRKGGLFHKHPVQRVLAA
jgi:integrase